MLEFRKYRYVYMICGFLGAVCFLIAFGPEVLNPVYDEWLLGEGADLTQHYIGWLAYRQSSWNFPLGCTDNLAYPFHTSVIFTDSIPLFAVIFKFFSPILPETFQYFGLYGLLCYVLQAVLGAVILKKFIKDKTAIVLGSLFFVLSPVLLARMFYHTALSGHFLLLLAMLGVVYYEEVFCKTENVLKLSVLTAFLAASIHIYLLAMCAVVWLVYCVLDLLKTKKICRTIAAMVFFLLTAAITVWILGGFGSVFKAGRGGLGSYGLNINGFVNSQGNSALIKGMSLPDIDGTEGFAYLGAGILLLLTVDIFLLIRKRRNIREMIKNNREKWLAVALFLLLMYLFSILPVVYLNDRVLFELHLPVSIEKVWSVFRVTGRFSWLIYYTCFMFAVILPFVLSGQNKKFLFVALGMALLLQIYDITPLIAKKKEDVTDWPQQHIRLLDPCWEDIAAGSQVKHVYYGFSDMEYDVIYPVTEWAVRNGMTVNRFYFARSLDKEAVANVLGDAMWEKNPDSIFVFRPEDREFCEKNGFSYIVTAEHLLLAGEEIE